MVYCEIDDVLNAAPVFRNDVVPLIADPLYPRNTGRITRDTIDQLIAESTAMVQYLLLPRYSIETIETYGSALPPLVVYLTAIYTALLMYERLGAAQVEKNQINVKKLQERLDEIKTIVANGAIVDSSGDRVPVSFGIVLKKNTTQNQGMTALKEAYENGRVY